MSTLAPQKTVPKIRTYAADLDNVRARDLSQPVTKSEPVIQEKKPAPVISKENTVPIITAVPVKHIPRPEPTPVSAATVVPVPVPKRSAPQDVPTTPTKIVAPETNISATDVAKESFPAVIITDNKHKRFKLSEAIIDSVSSWWSTKKEDARKKKIPKYTVPVAERRKGVIQKATTKTGRTSTADHRAVLDNLKAAKQISHDTKLTPVLKEVKKEKPVWETSEPKKETVTINAVVEKRKSHSEKEGVLHEQKNNWESDLQAQVNKLTDQKDEAKSPIIITGKEFSKIKELKKVSVENTVKPIIPKPVTLPEPVHAEKNITPIIPTAPAEEVGVTTPVTPTIIKVNDVIESKIETAEQNNIAAKASIPTTPKIIRPIIPTIPESSTPQNVNTHSLQNELKPVFVKATRPAGIVTPITRPKIVPVIPPSINNVVVGEPVATKATVDPIEVPAVENVPKTPKQERRFAPPRKERNSLLVIIDNNSTFIYIGLALILFIGGGVYLSRPQTIIVGDNQPVDTPITNTTFVNTTVSNETTLAQDKNSMATKIQEASQGNDSLVEVNFISPETGNQLTAGEFFSLINAKALFDFTASINKMSLGGYRGEPWIALQISDQNTARGGMLNWENKMSSNLDPLFGATVNKNQSSALTPFSDDIVGATDVRILKDANGAEKITYGFVAPNMILITTNTTTFLNLANNLNQY